MAEVGDIGIMGRGTTTITMITGPDITAIGIMVRRRTTATIRIIRAPGADTAAPITFQAVSPNPVLDSSLARAEIGDIVTDCEVKDNHIQ